MSPRHRRRSNAGNDRAPEYTPEEVDRLTERADRLLAQLHEVLSEMAEHLESVASQGGDGG
jgi:hypothetical protein